MSQDVVNDIPVRAQGRDRTAGHHPRSTGDMTKQEFKDDADITKVMGRWRRQGFDGPPAYVNQAQPVFGDFTGIRDLEGAMLAVHEAKEAFRLLDARVRDRVDNDPEQFIEFCSDPENREEMIELGLIVTDDQAVPDLTEQFKDLLREVGNQGDPRDAVTKEQPVADPSLNNQDTE